MLTHVRVIQKDKQGCFLGILWCILTIVTPIETFSTSFVGILAPSMTPLNYSDERSHYRYGFTMHSALNCCVTVGSTVAVTVRATITPLLFALSLPLITLTDIAIVTVTLHVVFNWYSCINVPQGLSTRVDCDVRHMH